MWEIRLVTVGRAKDAGIREGLERYARMVAGEWRLVLDSVPQSKREDAASCRREECASLRRRLAPGRVGVALDAGGESLDSGRFASVLAAHKDAGTPITFLVGGPHGLDRETLGACDRRLSLSPMTLPHELAALVLAEQVYRAYAASGRKGYAK
jgi:23S rRNA (pseudouridine1915-N3)-methyltransferase